MSESDGAEVDDDGWCDPPSDYVAQRARAFGELAMLHDKAPEATRGEIIAFLGVMIRSIKVPAAATSSRLRPVKDL
jgi:hypothetical protein